MSSSIVLDFVISVSCQHLKLAKFKASLKLEPHHARFPTWQQKAEMSRGYPFTELSSPLLSELLHPLPVHSLVMAPGAI